MFSFQSLTARARQQAAAATATTTATGPRKPVKRPRRRIRFVEKGPKLIAQVDELHGFRWMPTEVIEEVDLHKMAVAQKMEDAIKRGLVTRNPTTGGFELTDTGGTDAATPWDHFKITSADDTAGFWSKVKKAAKKLAKNKVIKVIAKAHSKPLIWANKVTHGKNSPIKKAEEAMKRAVGKALPFTKPFIAVHTKLAGATQKAIASSQGGKKISAKDLKDALPSKADVAALAETNKRIKAEAIAKALKKVPKAQQAEARKALISKANDWIVISPRTGLTHSLKL